MNQTKNICVFCGSSTKVDGKYIELAREAGRMIAAKKFGVVYGGAHIGLMGAVADAALKENGRVIGIIPDFLKKHEIAHKGLSELHVTETMHERQVGMAERANAFLILPGGLGTLAEFFEIITFRLLELHDKPVVLLNPGGYWDSLLGFLEHAEAEKFMGPGTGRLFKVLPGLTEFGVFLDNLKAD